MSMNQEAVREKMKQPNVVVLNVLPDTDYAKLHIAGSENLPLGLSTGDFTQAVEKHYGKDKFFITYCAGLNCGVAPHAAKALTEKGFQADCYEGGMKDWSDAGLAVKGTDAPNRRALDGLVVPVGSK